MNSPKATAKLCSLLSEKPLHFWRFQWHSAAALGFQHTAPAASEGGGPAPQPGLRLRPPASPTGRSYRCRLCRGENRSREQDGPKAGSPLLLPPRFFTIPIPQNKRPRRGTGSSSPCPGPGRAGGDRRGWGKARPSPRCPQAAVPRDPPAGGQCSLAPPPRVELQPARVPAGAVARPSVWSPTRGGSRCCSRGAKPLAAQEGRGLPPAGRFPGAVGGLKSNIWLNF